LHKAAKTLGTRESFLINAFAFPKSENQNKDSTATSATAQEISIINAENSSGTSNNNTKTGKITEREGFQL
jgi:hypothetical protein